nr:hypothetical protein [Candidatus Hakubella thermalkaliphila]
MSDGVGSYLQEYLWIDAMGLTNLAIYQEIVAAGIKGDTVVFAHLCHPIS